MSSQTSNEKRFWSKVEILGEDECWEWKGARVGKYGYGAFSFYSDRKWKMVPSHRVSYALANGPFDKDLCVCHHCDNPPCVNPKHLFVGTRLDNALDRVAKGRSAMGDHANAPKGKDHYNARLSENDVREIRKLLNSGISQPKIGEMYGVKRSQISHIKTGLRWSHVV